MKLHLRRHIRGLQHCIWLRLRWVCSEGKIHQIIHQISSKSEKSNTNWLTAADLLFSPLAPQSQGWWSQPIDPVRWAPLEGIAGGNQSLGKNQLPKNQTKRQYQGRGHSSSGSHHSPNICDGQLQPFIGIEGFREEVLRKATKRPKQRSPNRCRQTYERALQLPARGPGTFRPWLTLVQIRQSRLLKSYVSRTNVWNFVFFVDLTISIVRFDLGISPTSHLEDPPLHQLRCQEDWAWGYSCCEALSILLVIFAVTGIRESSM